MADAVLWGTWDEARAACDTTLSEWVTVLDATVGPAIQGDRVAARAYAHSYVGLVAHLSAHLPAPPEAQRWLARVARREAVSLPFRSCMVEGRAGLAITMTLLSDLRRMAPGVAELEWEDDCETLLPAGFGIDEAGIEAFDRVVDGVVDGSDGPLEEVIATFGLTYTDVGRLFGVSRQAVTQWLAEGIPGERQAKAATIAQVAALLRHSLVPERLPGLARRPADAYGGRSMLEMIEADEHLELLDLTRRSFDWAATA